jgi:hypothetical protein
MWSARSERGFLKNFSYKMNVHMQMSIGTGNGTVADDYPIDFIHLLHRVIVFTKYTRARNIKSYAIV